MKGNDTQKTYKSEEDMKNNRLFTTICLMAAILLTACTQDELAEQGNTLPDGEYPLRIGSVSITAESSEEPWTRVAENETDGMGSHWTGGERIGVRIAGSEETGIYQIKVDDAGNVTVSPGKSVYWQSTQPAEVTAWYPAEASRVSLGSQHMDGLAYVLRGTGTGSYQSPVTLKFEHQLAKVRVVLSGTQAGEVEKVEVHNYTSCTHVSGGNVVGSTEGWITMHRVDAATYEANVVPGTINLADFICLNSTTVVTNLTGLPTTLEAGTMYTANITVGEPVLQDGTTITEAGTYNMQGTYTQGITISGTGITVKLDGVTLNTSDIGINVQSDATIQVSGANNTITSGSAGIYVAEGSTVTITGRDRNDVLTAQAGGDAAGIGGCNNNQDCGSINISNVTVIARGSQLSAISPGIGSTSTNRCGQITIDNATIHAYGEGLSNTAECPAIGTGIANSLAYGSTLPTVIIRNGAEVHAHRGGSSADYIGYPFVLGSSTGAASTINPGAGGSITDSTVYKYTYNAATGSSSGEGTVVYDASGNATEQPQ